MTSNAMCSSGTIAFRIEFSTICRPGDRVQRSILQSIYFSSIFGYRGGNFQWDIPVSRFSPAKTPSMDILRWMDSTCWKPPRCYTNATKAFLRNTVRLTSDWFMPHFSRKLNPMKSSYTATIYKGGHLLGTPETSLNGRSTRNARRALTSNASLNILDKTVLTMLETTNKWI